MYVNIGEFFPSLFKVKVDRYTWILCNNLGKVTSRYNLGSVLFSAAAFLAREAEAIHQ